MRVLPLGTAVLAALLALVLESQAHALVWPDVPERVEKDLASTDPAVRATAAEKLDALGAARATPLILRSLGDSDTAVRIAAAATAVRARTEGATALVIPWLGEHDVALRIAACAVARAIPDPRAVPPLARALSDADGVVRTSAIEALGVQRSADAVAPLLGKLDDPNPTVRIELARALARLHDARAVVPLIGKVEDSVPEVRQAVARALGDLGDPRAAPALLLQLRDASPEVRIMALTALGRVHGTEVVDALGPSVTDRNASVRHAALATLAMLAKGGSQEALRVLVGRLGMDEDAGADLATTAVREALVTVGGSDALVTALRGVLRGGASPPAAASAAWVLGALAAKGASADIVGAMRRGTLPPPAALHALATAGGADDLPVVLELVGSDSATVRAEAFAAAHALLDPAHPDGRAVEPLLAVAESPRLTLHELARVIELLGRTGATRASAPLQGFVHSRDLATKLAAVDALRALGPTGADAALLPLVRDEVPEVRFSAAAALSACGGAHARDALVAMLARGTELDRVAALIALGGILAREPNGEAIDGLAARLDVAVGGERDAVLLALARAAPTHPAIARVLVSGDGDDRRTVFTAYGGRPDTAPLLRRGLADPDSSARAQAAWSLGTAGGADVLGDLQRVAHTMDATARDSAVDATAAIARIGVRTHAAATTATLCGLVHDARPLVRTNALAGLALAGSRCEDGADRALLRDPAEAVRLAAARAVSRTAHGPEDAAALAECVASDHSAEVAAACERAPASASGRSHATLVYVERLPPGELRDPRAGAPYVVELADGLVRAGTVDRRGAFFDPVAPEGVVRLRSP